jgi:hypothetical protein
MGFWKHYWVLWRKIIESFYASLFFVQLPRGEIWETKIKWNWGFVVEQPHSWLVWLLKEDQKWFVILFRILCYIIRICKIEGLVIQKYSGFSTHLGQLCCHFIETHCFYKRLYNKNTFPFKVVKMDMMCSFCVSHHVDVCVDAFVTFAKMDTRKIFIKLKLALLCMVIENIFNCHNVWWKNFGHPLLVANVGGRIFWSAPPIGQHENVYGLPERFLVIWSRMAIDPMTKKNWSLPKKIWVLPEILNCQIGQPKNFSHHNWWPSFFGQPRWQLKNSGNDQIFLSHWINDHF